MPGHCFANRLAALTADRLTSALGSFISATRVVPSLADVRAEALEPPVAFWEDKETKARRERKERDRKAPCVAGALGARGRHRACVPPGCFNCLRAHRTWPINEAKTRASVPLDATVASECTAISPSTQPPPAPLPPPCCRSATAGWPPCCSCCTCSWSSRGGRAPPWNVPSSSTSPTTAPSPSLWSAPQLTASWRLCWGPTGASGTLPQRRLLRWTWRACGWR